MQDPQIFFESDRWGVVDSMHSDRRVYFKAGEGNTVAGLCLQPKQPLLALLSNTGSTLWDIDSAGSMPFNSDTSYQSANIELRGGGSIYGVYIYSSVAVLLAILILGLCYWQYKVRKQRRKPSQPLSIALQSISVVISAHAGKTHEANLQSAAYTEPVPAATGAKPSQ
ncbi:hypothetical protein HDU81_008734 [Chytriomyces hyalinus]|nr:hypothetical protein HDU81_008734 [Chytriomyces hyalinus]